VDEVERVRYVVDRAIARIALEPRYRPLARLSGPELRRLLAEAHYRDMRNLRREIEAEGIRAEE